MSELAEARIREMDAELDAQTGPVDAGEVFQVVDTLDAHVGLRKALSDPGASPDARAELATAVFGSKAAAPVVQLVAAAVRRRWPSASALSAALERQGVRAALKSAQVAEQLDNVEDEMFRFGQTVAGNPELADALTSRQIPLAHRLTLVDSLLGGKALPATLVLVRRAVAARRQNFALTLESMLQVAAEVRDRALARVSVARPLEETQLQKLRVILMRMVGRAVDIQVVVDPDLLGGMRIQVGDEVIEGTVRHRLTEVSRSFS